MRLLIANRGEIACRIARSARRLGATVIAVYSDVDRGACHVREADEAFRVGPAPAAESYLHVGRIIETALRARADAVHPGYGFLSENANFARACVDAGLVFVGPPPAAIAAMGSKSAAKKAMAAAGVPVAPGYHGDDQDLDRLRAEALRIGFPLIIKASAGGGGKGMQVVESESAVAPAIASAQRLARTTFGDERLLLERFFPHARHVEVQLLADQHGFVVPLFDRDCSVQRRHQKVIEEAPAPGLSPKLRAGMAQAAVTVARAVGYTNAGTVEFLADEEQFYFMEMNTRLQVEHAVTELITGLDLVEWQLRIARGEPLPAAFATLEARGTAMEARLYAEDPAQEYLPSVGRIVHLRWPAGEDVRVDAGVEAGDEVSAFYDPLLGKVIAWGAGREEACRRLGAAVADTEIIGVTTNRALLSNVLGDAQFRSGAVDTGFLERRTDLARGEPAADAVDLIMAALWHASPPADLPASAAGNPWRRAGMQATPPIEPPAGGRDGPAARRAHRPVAPWDDTSGWRLGGKARSRWRFGTRVVELTRDADDAWLAELDSERYKITLVAREAGSLYIELASVSTHSPPPAGSAGVTQTAGNEPAAGAARGEEISPPARIERARLIDSGRELHLFRAGGHVSLMLASTDDALCVAAPPAPGSLRTPLPGTVVAVHVQVGQRVAPGEALVTVEAMKMEHTLTAPHAGMIGRVVYGPGEPVAAGAFLIEMS